MDDGIELVCPTEEGGEAGTVLKGDAGGVARFAFKGRDPEDVRLSDVRGPKVFRVAVDREPGGAKVMDDAGSLAFRLRMGREARDEPCLGVGNASVSRFAIGR